MLAFLARECGWSPDWIADTLTLQQILLYYRRLQEQKQRDLRNLAITIGQCVAYGSGNMKVEDFDKFVDSLYVVEAKAKTVDKAQLKQMRTMGIIEEQ